jgi:hypothetical protein
MAKKNGGRGKTGGSGLVMVRIPSRLYEKAKTQTAALAAEVVKATGVQAKVSPASVITRVLEKHL